MTPSSDTAFSPSVKAVQQRRGSRAGYAKIEGKGGFATLIDESLGEFIDEQRSFYLATVNADGQPYIQHRGGPPGFLRVLDEKTLAFADFSGNRQFISTGNLADNAKAMLFLMDYANRTGTHRQALPRGLQSPRRAGHRLHHRGVGQQLPAAYPADVLRGGRCPDG